MTILTLASGTEGSWKIVFDRVEAHLYVCFTEDDAVPVDGMTVEDFLAIVPWTALHSEAHRRFIQLLHELFANH